MSKRIDLLRMDYAFSVLIPCLVAIYFNHLNIFDFLDIMGGFFMFAITGNTLNDAIDMRNPNETDTIERVKGYHWKELAALSIVAFTLGITLFFRTIIQHPINGIILGIIIIMVVFYCLKKNFPIINQIILATSHVFLPYLMIKIDANISHPLLPIDEVIMLITFISFAVTGQLVHEVIDGDSITQYSPKTQQKIIILFSVLTMILGTITIILKSNWFYSPLIVIPIGIIYTFRRPTRSTKGVKDIGLIMGNLVMIYLVIIIINQMRVDGFFP